MAEIFTSPAAASPPARGHVKVEIGKVRLGEPATPTAPGKPNPKEISWEQKFGIERHYPTGRKPITECVQPLALWEATIQFETTTETGMAEIRDLPVGPHYVRTSLHKICMYLERKRMVQLAGTDDFKYSVTLGLVEANDGGTQ